MFIQLTQNKCSSSGTISRLLSFFFFFLAHDLECMLMCYLSVYTTGKSGCLCVTCLCTLQGRLEPRLMGATTATLVGDGAD